MQSYQTTKTTINSQFSSSSFLKDFPIIETKKYILKLASPDELESIFRLRFKIFNIELGLEDSTANHTQIDQDEFDEVCHHLILIFKQTGEIIGTYRMQTHSMASQALGFRSAKYFNLNAIFDSVLQETVELGRACIAKEYRSIQALSLLWQGLANYLLWSGNTYFLGCTTLPTQDISQAHGAYHYFQQNNFMHPRFLVYPTSQFFLELPQYCPKLDELKLPIILQIYLASGAKICSLPAIDRLYKCIDFLTIFDSQNFATVGSLMSTTSSTVSSLVKRKFFPKFM
ncbi:MAG: GNAT family N-acetyltransferase [Trichormus sp. ATA11-4-KO1]|jgi:putative hemolysin|nr:GNAT family N-acetyltransferase [Trichormus sp. ATA11-4-KO1]